MQFATISVNKNEDDESTMITDSPEHKIINLKNFWPKWKWDSFKKIIKQNKNKKINFISH